MKHVPGIMLAAPKSGSGKTLLTIALLTYLQQQNKHPRAIKCGPDYIDPMFHRKVMQVPSKNLDTWMADEKTVSALFSDYVTEDCFVIAEGVMGLYDGLGGVLPQGSSYDLAETLGLPIVIILDAHGMGRTMVAILQGLVGQDTAGLIRGVILNKTSKHFYQVMKPMIEEQVGISCLGYFPKTEALHLESRHLGLKLPEEIADLKEQLSLAADFLVQSVDVEALLALGEEAVKHAEKAANKTLEASDKKVRIAVAMDEAFCFIYEDNLALLRSYGAEIVPFSPLKDEKLPEQIGGLILYGGYPELYAKALSENTTMRASINSALTGGLPCLAECGGFMYLHDSITAEDGVTYPMCGVVKGNCSNTGKLVRFGYIEMEGPKDWLGDKAIRGHEFHYYDTDENGSDVVVRKPVTGRTYSAVLCTEEQWLGFPHLYYPSNPAFVKHFIEQVCKFSDKQ